MEGTELAKMWKSKNGSDDLHKAAPEGLIGVGLLIRHQHAPFLELWSICVPVCLEQELVTETTTFLGSHVNLQFCNNKGGTHKNIRI